MTTTVVLTQEQAQLIIDLASQIIHSNDASLLENDQTTHPTQGPPIKQ